MKRETEEKRNVIKAAMERIVQRLFTIIFLISIMAFQPSLGQQAKNLKDSPIKFYPNHHKKDKDTLQQWMSKFYTLGTMKISKNNRWVMLNKIYKRNNDTVLVFDSTKPDQVIHTIIKRPQNFFLGSGYILTSGNGKAEFLDVKMNQKKVYENIQRAEVLNKSNQYFILDKNKNLSLYDKNAKLIHSTSGVADYVSDKKSKIFVSEKLEKMKNTMVSVLLNDKKSIDKETLYSTENEITKLELIPSGKYVTVTEKIRDSDLLQITFVETGTRSSTIKKNFKSFSGKADFVMVSEIQNGNSYLIDFDKRIPLVKEEMVEIWYGTDKKLREKKYGSQQHQYLLWNPKLNESVKLPTDQFSSYASIGSDRYFLAFNSDEEFNYTSGTHLYSMHLYDKLMGSSERIFTKTYRIIVSPDGRYISAYDEKIKGWVLYDTLESAFIPVKNKGKLSPVFSSDNQFVLFESENDLWQMDLKTKEVKRLNIAPNQDVKISNLITETLFRQFNVSVELRAVDLQKPMLLKVRDKERNLTSCINWKKGKSEVIIPPSQNRIKDFKYNEGGNSIFSIEENYNSPPVLYRYSNKGAVKTQIFRSGKEDKIIKNLKQEILSYTNTAETPLKGMLYYPIGFNLNKNTRWW
ncbi:hypothetical protein EG345_18225 [Chryseobacterium carnipullorum]|uniref:hypothetical protein n=1 Tax=Chryseobacterium carnipullorum TaxID=1124835 RepID=UPI000F4E71AE|nr:hypothetical protein [Chryseobacterium carnipullorum]AZA66413.1 hypothetical protein EG345_18225 [Chryseobacterium carnipullorum]